MNPVQPEFQMLGVYDLKIIQLYLSGGKQEIHYNYSMDGYDEISLTSQFKVVSNRGEQLFMPDDLGFKRIESGGSYGGDTQKMLQDFRDVLSASATEAQTNAVLVNAALEFRLLIDQNH